jgi:dephospho-CoA kinase
MGKSTTAKMFAELGCDVWDADAAVHRLYGKGGDAVAPIQQVFPNAIVDQAVSRGVLKQIIGQTPEVLKQIEQIVHPLVGQDRAEFRRNAVADILVFDIPILFETGGDAAMDAVVVVSVSPEVQEQRVMARGTMTREQFLHIRGKQMPDADKRALADYVIVTDTLDHALQQVRDIVEKIRVKIKNA